MAAFDPRMPEANLVHVVAVKVEIPSAFSVDEEAALAPFQHVQAGRGERLMQKVTCIFFKKLACLCAEILA